MISLSTRAVAMILRSEPSLGTFEPVVALNNPVGVGATLVAHQPKQNLHPGDGNDYGEPRQFSVNEFSVNGW